MKSLVEFINEAKSGGRELANKIKQLGMNEYIKQVSVSRGAYIDVTLNNNSNKHDELFKILYGGNNNIGLTTRGRIDKDDLDSILEFGKKNLKTDGSVDQDYYNALMNLFTTVYENGYKLGHFEFARNKESGSSYSIITILKSPKIVFIPQ